MCGIFGIINKKPKTLDTKTFFVLGVENDSRGGDSCGIFIDGKYEYGVDTKKLFSNFFPESKLLNRNIKHTIALGHCRKASVGAINEANAQPVIIKNNNKIEYVLIHNGTIYNYKELATKYIPNIDISNMTDSQVMAHIFYHAGYDVLGEYIGAGAFVMVDYRGKKEQVYIFKGGSKATMYSTAITEERPLYCTYDSSEFIFSSIPTYLKALRPKNTLYKVGTNQLCKIVDAQPKVCKIYDRSELCQSAPKVVTYPSYYEGYGTSYNSKWLGCISCTDEFVFKGKDFICHGPMHVNSYGGTYSEKRDNTELMYFWNGSLLKNKECFDYLKGLAKEFECTAQLLDDSFPELINYLSIYPYVNYQDEYIKASTPDTIKVVNGEIEVPFAYRKLVLRNGLLTERIYTKEKTNLIAEVRLHSSTTIDFSKIDSQLFEYEGSK